MTTTPHRGPFPYERVIPHGDDAFAVIGRLALAADVGISGLVGDAKSHLFAARPLVAFAVSWLQQHFSGGSSAEAPQH
jgi:aminoglycoside 3-N-acetyltransferase